MQHSPYLTESRKKRYGNIHIKNDMVKTDTSKKNDKKKTIITKENYQ